MSNKKKYTEVELIQAKRDGWEECIEWYLNGSLLERCDDERDRRFPMPGTRPRVVQGPSGSWYGLRPWPRGSEDVEVRAYHSEQDARNAHAIGARITIKREDYRTVADLLANPTEKRTAE